MACAKLQAEGIRAVVIDSEVAVTNPLVVPYARVQVAESDRAAAEEILARPAPDDAEGEYVKEDWRCPKCHRKTVELLPPSGAGLAARFGCLGMAAVSVLFVASQWMMPEDWYRTAEQFVAPGLIPWVLLGAVVFVVWMFSKRDKRCESCGHEWSTGDDKDE